MHIKKIILTVLCLSLCLCVCSCTFINNAVQETKRVAEFTVDFSETPNVLIWKEPDAPFICIEPWCGVPDHDGEVRELSEKDGIIKLEKNGVITNTHTIILD